MKQFQGRVICPGTCEAEALVSHGGFNTLASYQMALMFHDKQVKCGDQNNPDLYKKPMIGKALCLPETIGSTTGGMVLYTACASGQQPACMLFSIALTALVTGLVLWFFFPNSALMGASGVVFMLIVLASFAGMRTGTIPLTLILVLILYLGSEIFQAVTGTAGLAQLTHIAGGVLGMIFGFTWSRGKRAVR